MRTLQKMTLGRLLQNRKRFLEKRPVYSIVRTIGKLSGRWLKKNFAYRKKAVYRLCRRSGFSEAQAERTLDALFRELTAPKLVQLLKSELKDPLALDGFRRDSLTGTSRRARGPEMVTHVFSGNVPNPAIVSFIFGMLLKSVNVGKASSRDEGFLDIYLESLKRSDRALAKTNFLIPPHDRKVASEFLKRSGLVVAYGSDESINQIRKQVPLEAAFFGYGHKASFAIYTKKALRLRSAGALAKKTALDIWMMNQKGCLSPLAVYLEKGGEVSPLLFSQKAALSLSKMGRWLTLYDERMGEVPLSSGHKIIYFKPFEKIKTVIEALAPFSRHLQAISLEAEGLRRKKIAEALSSIGANRICRAGKMQAPPITWHHDGRLNLANWVTWTHRED